MPLIPGSTLGAYRIIEPLGKGGMAAAYKTLDDGGTAAEAEAMPGPSTTAPPAGTTGLAIDFEHHFRSDNMKVWVEEKLTLDQRLGGRVVAFRLHKGGLGEAVEVSPGKHTIRVQGQWDDNVRTESIAGAFQSGRPRRLEVQVGRIRKNLTLEWS